MTTVVNNPVPTDSGGNGIGMVVGLVLVAIMILLFFVYGLPALRNVSGGGTQVNIPDQIDVNVNQPSE